MMPNQRSGKTAKGLSPQAQPPEGRMCRAAHESTHTRRGAVPVRKDALSLSDWNVERTGEETGRHRAIQETRLKEEKVALDPSG